TKFDPPLNHREGPDENVEIERTARGQIAERAGIGPATCAFELGDDLHAAELRHARDRAAGKYRPYRTDRRHVRSQAAAHVRDDVMHVRIGLGRHELIDPHRARLAHAPEVVALEV